MDTHPTNALQHAAMEAESFRLVRAREMILDPLSLRKPAAPAPSTIDYIVCQVDMALWYILSLFLVLVGMLSRIVTYFTLV